MAVVDKEILLRLNHCKRVAENTVTAVSSHSFVGMLIGGKAARTLDKPILFLVKGSPPLHTPCVTR